MVFAQRRIVEIHHRDGAMIAGIESRVERAKTERTFFDRNITTIFLPSYERLAVAAVDPQTGIGEIGAQNMFSLAFLAHDGAAGAWHGKGDAVRETVDFEYVCQHLSFVICHLSFVIGRQSNSVNQ